MPPFDQVALETVQKFANTTNAAPVNSGNDKIEAELDDYFDAGIRQRMLEGVNVGIDGFYKIRARPARPRATGGQRRDGAAELSREPRVGIGFQPDVRTLRAVGILQFFVRGPAGAAHQRGGLPGG